ncbi:ABC transporter permease, partial [Corynebacterium sp.]|uniref:ABC transporter permease n=2 Tax=Corynebacterium TaxID=1716 RepID=UPI0026494417
FQSHVDGILGVYQTGVSAITGLRLSLSTAWLVIVAAEMLIGGRGVGFFVWNAWNRLDIDAIVVAIFIIGIAGLILDHIVGALQKVVRYD